MKPLQGVLDTSYTYGNANIPVAAGLSRSEFSVPLVNDGTSGAKWGSPCNVYIALAQKNGPEFWAPYISVRVRNLSGALLDLRVYLVATAL
jgi:hypothetical protein